MERSWLGEKKQQRCRRWEQPEPKLFIGRPLFVNYIYQPMTCLSQPFGIHPTGSHIRSQLQRPCIPVVLITTSFPLTTTCD